MLSRRLNGQVLQQKPLPKVKLPWKSWAPDLADYENPGDTEAKNVIPVGDGYKPFPNVTVQSDALTDRCQGAVSAKDTAGNIFVYSGDKTNLYRLADQSWSDVSGATYTTAADSTWEFAKFGTSMIATNYNDAVQSITIQGSGNFAALITSTEKPKAKHIDIIRDFVVLGNINSTADGVVPNRVHWSGINNATDFDPDAKTQSDYQDIPTGGNVQRVVGGVEYGLIFMERQIWRMTYAGSPLVFQFDAVDRRRGTAIPNGVVSFGRLTFYISEEGFFMSNGLESIPIGHNQVDREFWNQFDIANAHRVWGALDQPNKTVMWLFPGSGNSAGQPNMIFIYNWVEQKWAKAEVSDFSSELDVLFWGGSSGYTLDGLDSVSTDIDALTESLDSPAWQGSEKIAAFDSDKKYVLFTGSNLPATMETAEYDADERSLIRNTRPIIDTSSATVAIASKTRIADTSSFGTASAMNTDGECPLLSEGRYHKARVSTPDADTWTRAEGLEIEASRSGKN